MQRVGNDDALDRRVRDVALVPQRDVFERGLQVAAQHPGQAAHLLGLDRVALVRHRARALLLALAESLLGLAHLGALEVTDLERERSRCSRRSTRTCTSPRRGDRAATPAWRARAAGRGARTRSARPTGRRSSTCRPRRRACRRRSSPAPARVARDRAAPACAQSASLAPNVVGSAWMPCVRPTIGVSRNSRARFAIAFSSSAAAPASRSTARVICSASAVSTTSLDVRP